MLKIPTNKNLTYFNTTKSTLSQLALASSDVFWFCMGPFVAMLLAWLLWGDLTVYIPDDERYARLSAHFVLAVFCLAWFWVRLRHYTYRKPFWFELKEIFRTIFIFSVIDLAILAFSKWHVSRYFWIFTWGTILITLPIGRFLVKTGLRRTGLWIKDCVIIGTGPNAMEAYRALRDEQELGLRFVYFFAPDPSATVFRHLMDLRVVQNERLLWRTTDPRHTQYVIALEDGQELLRERWLQKMAKQQCRVVSVVPSMRGVPLNSTDVSYLFRYELLLLKINTNLTKRSSRLVKMLFDIVVAWLLLFVLSPVLLFLMLWGMRDGGSPIYGHTRVGKDGRLFKCFKFRTMVMNSQEVLEKLLATDPKAQAEWNKDFKLRHDPRITRVGHFLRKTSLDELPQLWNVIRGEMSLVGPRPVVEEELSRYGDNKDYYLMAKPGMTGLWQVSGRNDVGYETRVYFDAWYVKNWSLWNDIIILFKTVEIVFNREGAY